MPRGPASKVPPGGAPKRGRKRPAPDHPVFVRHDGMFNGVHAVLIPGGGVLEKQLHIWCRKVTAMGGACHILVCPAGPDVIDIATHVCAADTERLEQRMASVEMVGPAARAVAVSFKWLEESLSRGALAGEDQFLLRERGWYLHDRKAPKVKEPPRESLGAPAVDLCGGDPSAVGRGTPCSGDGCKRTGTDGEVVGTAANGRQVGGCADSLGSEPGASGGPSSRCPDAQSEGSDGEGPSVRDALKARLRGGSSRIERVQEWMKAEVTLRRKRQPLDEGGESQVVGIASQDMEEEDEAEVFEIGEGDAVPLDLNEHITRHFAELRDVYEALGDEWRSLTYRRALATLERVPFRITCVEQLAGVAGVGPQVRDKVKEILGTGRLAKLSSFKNDAKLSVLRLFSSVFGIGAKTALELYSRGHRSLADLRADSSLSRQVQLGLQYYGEIGVKMSRDDIDRIVAVVKREAEAVCPGVWCEVLGSYRRGKALCGDVDLLVTHPDGKSHRGLLPRLHKRLSSVGFLTVDLRSLEDSAQVGEGQCQTYMGMCRLPGTTANRRIDIKVYPAAVYSTALVHFTGNDVFNRKLRFYALQIGFKLSEYGLFPVTKIGKRKFVEKTSVSCATERDVFTHLGLEYLEPHERNW